MKHKIKKLKFQVRAHFQCERKIAVNSSTESVKPSDTSTHTHTYKPPYHMCSIVCKKADQQLFDFHLKFVSHSTYILSKNIYLSHIGPSIHKWCEQERECARVGMSMCMCVCVCTRPLNNCNGSVNYSVGVWQPNCCWLQHARTHTRNAWLEFSWMDGPMEFVFDGAI